MRETRLGNIANVDLSGIDKKTRDGERAVRLCNFTNVYRGWAVTKNMYDGLMTATASEKDFSTFLLRKGQVAITKDSETRDDIGIATYIADDFDDVVLGYHCALITPKDDIPEDEKVYGKYLNALLHTQYAQKYFSNNATGSGQRYTLSKKVIEDMPLLLPSIGEQKCIGDFLSDIDRKIEIDNYVNAELESMVKQIYDYWFVQFDFPNEEGKPYKSSGGKMVWNETLNREIPEGWSIKKLKDLFDCNVNGTEPGNHLSGLDYCPIDEIPIRRMSFSGGKGWEEANSSLQLYNKRDILIGAMRVYFHRCSIASNPGITRTTTLVLTPKDLNNLSYLYQVCNEERTFIYATRVSTGTQQPYVTWESLSLLDVPYPNNDKPISDYCIYTNSIIDKVLDNVQEVAELQSLRDYLLPLLMNGQVTIKD